MSVAATVTGMEVVFIGAFTEDTFTFQRVHGTWAGLAEGSTLDRADSFCARLLRGAPTQTTDAASDASYCTSPAVDDYDIRSYVGVPIRNSAGQPLGTLCGIDHTAVTVEEDAVDILRDLARLIAAHLETAPTPGVAIRRTPGGWQVDGVEEGDLEAELCNAMTLADLIHESPEPRSRPDRPTGSLDEVAQLRLSVSQLEHALAARVVVEQAIGVLAERQRIAPRAAFERLRRAARSRGRKVHLLAREVVDSAHTPGVPLPPDLAGRRG